MARISYHKANTTKKKDSIFKKIIKFKKNMKKGFTFYMVIIWVSVFSLCALYFNFFHKNECKEFGNKDCTKALESEITKQGLLVKSIKYQYIGKFNIETIDTVKNLYTNKIVQTNCQCAIISSNVIDIR